MDAISSILGHADKRSTDVYKKLADRAVVDAVKPRKGATVSPTAWLGGNYLKLAVEEGCGTRARSHCHSRKSEE